MSENVRSRKEYKLTEDDINYVNKIAKKYNMQSSEALSKIINEHREPEIELRLSNVEETIKKILFAMNSIDKNSEIVMEIFNSICISKNIEEFTSRREFKATILKEAETEISKKISALRVKKLDNER